MEVAYMDWRPRDPDLHDSRFVQADKGEKEADSDAEPCLEPFRYRIHEPGTYIEELLEYPCQV